MKNKRRERWEQRQTELLQLGTTDHYEDVELYDYEYADRTDDIRWYRRLSRELLPRGEEPPRILELGAGTGRISCPLARDGFHVTALDRMPGMLAGLRRRIAGKEIADRIEPVEADMRELPVADQSVALAIAPFNALMHVYTWSDLRRCFEEVHRVLQPSGTFAFDVQLPDLDWLTWDPDERHAVTRFVHPVTGERLVYSTNHRYDPQTQICHIRIFYDDAPPRGRKFRPPAEPRRLVHLAHRQIFPEELRMLVAIAGFELREHSGDFKGIPLSEASESQIVVCTKP
jgi:ubiquinone/menaquinone biosynthesis C-methylase UbiE